MQAINVGELKANFSEVLKKVQAGEESPSYMEKEKKLWQSWFPKFPRKKSRRKIGIGDKKGTVKFHSDFKMTEIEFLRL